MTMILAFLLKFGIGSIVSKLIDAYQARKDAETEQERIAADERIKTLEARRDVMIAEGYSPINAMIRALIAIGPTAYLLKIFIVDKLLCSTCSTDPLSDELWQVVAWVLGFYFLHSGAITVARILKR